MCYISLNIGIGHNKPIYFLIKQTFSHEKMAATELGGVESQSKESAINQGKFKCCITKECSVKICIKCLSIYHRSCAERLTLKVIDFNKVICCGKDETQITVDHEPANKEKMDLEINYLKKLLEENEEKISVLKENNTLLKDKIAYLNKEITNINTASVIEREGVTKKGVQTKTLSEEMYSKNLSFINQKPVHQIQKNNLNIMQNKQMDIMQEIINLEPSTSNMRHVNNRNGPSNQSETEISGASNKSPRNNMQDTYSFKQVLIAGKSLNKNVERVTGNTKKTKSSDINLRFAETANAENDFVDKDNLRKLEEKQKYIMEEVLNLERDKTSLKTNEKNLKSQEMQFMKRRPNIGNGEGDGAFHGKNEDNRKIWLFITRVPDDVTGENIKHYIETRTETDDVQIKKLPTYNSKSDNQSFMIGVQPHLQNTIYQTKFWPRKIVFDRFNFKRGRRFLDSHSHTSMENDADIQADSFLTPSM